jgi:hypothetical protein
MITTDGGQGELLQERRPALMSRAQLIERILEHNPTATPEFLSRFNENSLADYLDHLCVVDEPAVPWVRKGIAPAIVRRNPRE